MNGLIISLLAAALPILGTWLVMKWALEQADETAEPFPVLKDRSPAPDKDASGRKHCD